MTGRYPDEVDVAIVGSGPTGAAYARILSEDAPQATIAVFEVGPTVSDPPGAHVKNISAEAERSVAQRRSQGPGAEPNSVRSPSELKSGDRRARPGTYLLDEGYQADGEDGLPVVAFSSNVGGMGAHWTAACPRPGASERIAFLDATGELDELLAEADRLLGVTSNAFDAAPFADLVRERLAAVVDDGRAPSARVQKMPLAVHRREDGRLVWSGSDVVFGDATRGNPQFGLFDLSLVKSVLLDDGAASGVMVRDLASGETHEVRARFVVVAADALRTPQVLWASGIRPDALGRMLNDQSQVVFAARIRDAYQQPADAMASTGALTETSGVSWVPFTNELPFHGQVMQLDASPIPLAEDDPIVPGSIVGLGLFCAKDLQWDDRVVFSSTEIDGYGMPSMNIHYRLTDTDRATIARAQDQILTFADAVGERIGDRPFTLPLGASLHYQGTTRMGETDDGTSVCSPTSEVWEAPGVYVAGNNVIPTATACNPTLTSVALAVKGARDIAARLASV